MVLDADNSFFIGPDQYIECCTTVMQALLNFDIYYEELRKRQIYRSKYEKYYLSLHAWSCPKVSVQVLTWRPCPERTLKNCGNFITGWYNTSLRTGIQEYITIKSSGRIRHADRFICHLQICAN